MGLVARQRLLSVKTWSLGPLSLGCQPRSPSMRPQLRPWGAEPAPWWGFELVQLDAAVPPGVCGWRGAGGGRGPGREEGAAPQAEEG